MASYPISGYASASSIALSANGQIIIGTLSGSSACGFDLNITSSAATGTLSIYLQYTNPVGDTFTEAATETITVTAGTFPGGYTRYTYDSKFQSSVAYVVISWVGSDSSSGNIALVGDVIY